MLVPEPWQNHESMADDAEGVLRVPVVPVGAVGRPGLDGLYRRHADRRGARPQRAAPQPLLGDQGRAGRDGLGGRRARHPARRSRVEGAAAPGPHVPGRHVAGPHHRRRRDQIGPGRQASLSPVASRKPAVAGRSAGRGLGQRPPGRAAGQAAARLRLHARRSADPDGAHGHRRPGADRLDGQRHAAGRALRPAATALQLFQATVRPGDQSAARRDSRGDHHLAGDDDRLGRKPARRNAPAMPAVAARAADPDQHPTGADSPVGSQPA